jgi:hypothetical protein
MRMFSPVGTVLLALSWDHHIVPGRSLGLICALAGLRLRPWTQHAAEENRYEQHPFCATQRSDEGLKHSLVD